MVEKRKFLLYVEILLISLTCSLFFVQAQERTATILGVVQDPSGGVLPGVSVTARNVQTNLSRSSLTDQAGFYRIPTLPVGRYEVSAELTGFKKFTRTDITLTVNQEARIDIRLEVGEIAQQVTVSGDAPLVETEKPTLSGLVDARRVVDLPLNGRNPLELSFILPGVIPPEPGAVSTLNFSVSGQRGQSNNFLLDGGDNNDLAANFPSANPAPDAVQEFRILRNSYTAEFGRNSGAIINVITKSGSNEFHGNLFEFHRNRALNTRNFFDIAKPSFIRNQFGGTFGGPVVPDKSFFFLEYQGTREVRGITRSAITVPTALERQGNFSQSGLRTPLRSPFPGQPFTNNIIPQNLLSPTALGLLQRFVPPPNLGTNQFTANPPQRFSADEWMAKFDHNFTNNQTFSARYFFEDRTTFAPFAFGTGDQQLPGFGENTERRTNSITLNLNSLLSPAQVNEFRFTFQRFSLFGVVPVNRTPGPSVGFTGINPQYGAFPGLPLVTVGGSFSFGNSPQGPQGRHDNTFQWSDNYNVTKGAHSLKAGTDIRRFQQNQIFVFANTGILSFTGQVTGNPTADFLIGRAFNYQQNATPEQYYRTSQYNFYAQDDYKVRSNLTLNFGLRYELNIPTKEKFNRLASFRPGQQSRVFPNAPLGVVYIGDPGVQRATVPTTKTNFGPRIGFAWDPFSDGKTSVRAGYGIYYDVLITELQLQFLTAQPFALQFFRTGGVPSIENPFADTVNPFPFPGPQGPNTQFFRPFSATFLDPNMRNPYSQQYSLSIQRQVAEDVRVEVAYVGSRGTKLLRRRQGNPAIVGPGSTPDNIQQRRIFAPLGFGAFTLQETTSNSIYNALQFSVEKRYSRGFSLLGSYTFSRSIDNNSSLRFGSPQDPFNPGLDRALSDFDVTHRAAISYVWELPIYRDKVGVLGKVLGGWELAGATFLQSGFPFTVVTGRDASLRGVGADRPNLVADPHLSKDRPRGQRLAQYFNTAAFVSNGPGQNGTAGRNILRGPGINNFDVSVIKRTKLPGPEAHNIQFRAEFFNAFNRPNFFNPVSTLAAPSTILGTIRSAREPRIMQFALKYEF